MHSTHCKLDPTLFCVLSGLIYKMAWSNVSTAGSAFSTSMSISDVDPRETYSEAELTSLYADANYRTETIQQMYAKFLVWSQYIANHPEMPATNRDFVRRCAMCAESNMSDIRNHSVTSRILGRPWRETYNIVLELHARISSVEEIMQKARELYLSQDVPAHIGGCAVDVSNARTAKFFLAMCQQKINIFKGKCTARVTELQSVDTNIFTQSLPYVDVPGIPNTIGCLYSCIWFCDHSTHLISFMLEDYSINVTHNQTLNMQQFIAIQRSIKLMQSKINEMGEFLVADGRAGSTVWNRRNQRA